MNSTIIDFWTMVWEKKSHSIVMLSLLEENGEVSSKILASIRTTHEKSLCFNLYNII